MDNTEFKYSGWRPIREHKPLHHGKDGKPTGGIPDVPVVPATRFFDNMSFIGDEFIGCFVIETSEGIMFFDCLWPGDRHAAIIEEGLKELGLDPADLKVILVTHGHGDHFGCSDHFRQKYGTKVYMSEVDEGFALNAPADVPGGPMTFHADGYLREGEPFVLGDTKVRIYSTPGHTPGCLSFIVDVYDEGRKHTAALWGGTGIPRKEEMKDVYLESALRFTQICDEEKVDVEIATHPFVDRTYEKLALCRNICDGVANPFVIGREACRRYEAMFVDLCKSRM